MKLTAVGIRRKGEPGFTIRTAHGYNQGKTCSICGEVKHDFCQCCAGAIAQDDGLVVNVCRDCCKLNSAKPCDIRLISGG